MLSAGDKADYCNQCEYVDLCFSQTTRPPNYPEPGTKACHLRAQYRITSTCDRQANGAVAGRYSILCLPGEQRNELIPPDSSTSRDALRSGDGI